MKKKEASLAIVSNKKGQILLSKRFEPGNKSSHNKWQLPGGGVEENEEPHEAALREVMEEADIQIKLLSKTPIVVDKKNIKLLGFPAVYLSGTIDCSKDPESSEIHWFYYDDIDFKNSFAGTRTFILKALEYGRNINTN